MIDWFIDKMFVNESSSTRSRLDIWLIDWLIFDTLFDWLIFELLIYWYLIDYLIGRLFVNGSCINEFAFSPCGQFLATVSQVKLFIHSFIHSFIHLFIYSSFHLLIVSSFHLLIHSFIHPFIYSFIHSPILS